VDSSNLEAKCLCRVERLVVHFPDPVHRKDCSLLERRVERLARASSVLKRAAAGSSSRRGEGLAQLPGSMRFLNSFSSYQTG